MAGQGATGVKDEDCLISNERFKAAMKNTKKKSTFLHALDKST